MKTKFPILSLWTFLASTFVGLGISSCTKVEGFTDAPLSTQLSMPDIQKGVVPI